jgi:hypothetical protein
MRALLASPGNAKALRRLILVACLLPAVASAEPRPEQVWLDGLVDRVITDLAAGRPLVVEVHVPLCDNSIIACGNARLGDGDNPDTNLYWATTPGFGAWFARKGNGWKRVLHHRGDATGDADIVAIDVHRRTIRTPAAWRRRGAPATYELALVIHGWRGKAIDRALAAYAADLSGGPSRVLELADGTKLHAGGAAQLVAWVGHNRLMDLDRYTWPAPGKAVTGTIAIACHTAAYMEQQVASATRVPLLMTRDLLFANAAPLEATVLAFASGGTYATMRGAAADAYAAVRKRPVAKITGAFTNPSDRRWLSHSR